MRRARIRVLTAVAVLVSVLSIAPTATAAARVAETAPMILAESVTGTGRPGDQRLLALDPASLRTLGRFTVRGEELRGVEPSPDRRRVVVAVKQRTRRGRHVFAFTTVRVRGVTVERTRRLRVPEALESFAWTSSGRALVLLRARSGQARSVRVVVFDPRSARRAHTTRLPGRLIAHLPSGTGMLLLLRAPRSRAQRLVLLDASGRVRREVPVPFDATASPSEASLVRDPVSGHSLVVRGDRPELADIDVESATVTTTMLPLTGEYFEWAGPTAVTSREAAGAPTGPAGTWFLAPGTHRVVRHLEDGGLYGLSLSSNVTVPSESFAVRAFDLAGRTVWKARARGALVSGRYAYTTQESARGDITVRDVRTGRRGAVRRGTRLYLIGPTFGYSSVPRDLAAYDWSDRR